MDGNTPVLTAQHIPVAQFQNRSTLNGSIITNWKSRVGKVNRPLSISDSVVSSTNPKSLVTDFTTTMQRLKGRHEYRRLQRTDR
jgi:hypothetical protein